MNKSILIGLLLVGFTTSFYAQKMNSTEIADYQTALMNEKLSLDAIQAKKVKDINEKYTVKTVTLIEKEGSRFSKIGEMKSIQNDKLNELRQVLTSDQLKIYEDDVMPEIKTHMRKNIKPNRK